MWYRETMSDRMLMLVSLGSLLGTLGLYGYCLLAPPAEYDGLDPDAVEGSLVRVQGLAREVRDLSNGALAVELLPRGGGPAVPVYLPPDIDPSGSVRRMALTGAVLRVDGRLQKYNGVMEVVVDRASALRLLKASSLSVARDRPDLLANASVALAGRAFYKEVVNGRLSFRVLDRSDGSWELNCSAASYRAADEKAAWGNGTLVRVAGRLRYSGDPPVPRLQVVGGAGGVEPLG
jgi:hypothetical protein